MVQNSQIKDISGEVCLEENTNYSGNDITSTLDVPDVQHCRTFCKSNYPEASHFSWVSPSGPNWGQAPKKSCWCKTSDQGRSIVDGITSGRVDCGEGKKSIMCCYNMDHIQIASLPMSVDFYLLCLITYMAS